MEKVSRAFRKKMQRENKLNPGTVTCSSGVRRVSDKNFVADKSLCSAVRRHSKTTISNIKNRNRKRTREGSLYLLEQFDYYTFRHYLHNKRFK